MAQAILFSLLTAALLLAWLAPASPSSAAVARPNVLLVNLDDANLDGLSVMPNPGLLVGEHPAPVMAGKKPGWANDSTNYCRSGPDHDRLGAMNDRGWA